MLFDISSIANTTRRLREKLRTAIHYKVSFNLGTSMDMIDLLLYKEGTTCIKMMAYLIAIKKPKHQ